MHFHTYRVLVRRARKLAQQYYLVYQEPIPTGQLVQRVASVMQEYTQSGYVRTDAHPDYRHITLQFHLVTTFTLEIKFWFFSFFFQWSASIWCFTAYSWMGWRPTIPVPVRSLCMYFFFLPRSLKFTNFAVLSNDCALSIWKFNNCFV